MTAPVPSAALNCHEPPRVRHHVSMSVVPKPEECWGATPRPLSRTAMSMLLGERVIAIVTSVA